MVHGHAIATVKFVTYLGLNIEALPDQAGKLGLTSSEDSFVGGHRVRVVLVVVMVYLWFVLWCAGCLVKSVEFGMWFGNE